MSRTRLLRLSSVLAIAASVGIAPAAPAATASSCDANFCGDLDQCNLSLCFNCGQGISTQCELNWQCLTEYGKSWRIYCGAET